MSAVEFPPRAQPWPADHIERIRHLCLNTRKSGEAIAAELSWEIDRSTRAIRRKISELGLRRRKRPDDLPRIYRSLDDEPIDVKDARPIDDGRFAADLMRDVNLGLEHPPMIGVDTRPGTKAPIFVAHGDPDGLLRKCQAGCE